MEVIYMSTAVFLWQYLVRTNSAGYFMDFSGGLDSLTTASMLLGMRSLVLESFNAEEEKTLADLRLVTRANQ
jgi:NAD+ synthase (glutamine-hydrolysing)